MAWAIEWSDQALRDTSKLDRTVARRVVGKLEESAENPPHFFVRLAGSDDHKLRVGDYRVFVLLDYETQTILVERVEHRSRAYRGR